MSVKPYPDSPYYDDYDESKDYVQILAKAGNYAQSREITQIGTIFRDYLERMGNAVFSSGQIITGCELKLDPETKVATISTGTVFLEGLIRKIRNDMSVEYTG